MLVPTDREEPGMDSTDVDSQLRVSADYEKNLAAAQEIAERIARDQASS
jgi:hypothetical protein